MFYLLLLLFLLKGVGYKASLPSSLRPLVVVLLFFVLIQILNTDKKEKERGSSSFTTSALAYFIVLKFKK